ncbi:MAG: sigma factor-like helix-turn-helix DNA-binding protein [Myxococcota bacterium]
METGRDLRLLPELERVAGQGSDPAPWYCERVREAVDAALTEKQREVVELYFFQGWTEDAIAAHLGVRQQVVHKRLHGVRRDGRDIGGALRKLHHALEPLARMLRWA